MRRAFRVLALMGLTWATAQASAVLALLPADGTVSGMAGTSVGWGFDMTAGIYYVAIDSVTISGETSSLAGTGPGFIAYMPLLSGGLGDGATAPGQEWTLPFVQGSPGTGLGEYLIDAGTPTGASDSGSFVITYDEYLADPATCSCSPVDTLTMQLPGGGLPSFTVNVIDASVAAPEPATWILALAGLAALRLRKPRAHL
jgi:hypothetical protein